ncbi:MAG: SRPBCC family protein [Chloroflexi bacterium]|nr:SRPBCC family protein [Chloroflexota bacterium]
MAPPLASRRPGLEVQATFVIDRPRHEVYDFLADTTNFPKVDRSLIDYSPRAQMELGMEGTMRNRRGGMTAATTWRVATLEPGTRIEMEIRGIAYRMTELVTLRDASEGHGTEMQVLDQLWGTSFPGRLFVAASRGFIRRDLIARGAALQAVLAPASRPEPPAPT